MSGVSQLNGCPVTWHRSLSDLPPGPILLVAHELYDALPVHQVGANQLRGGGIYREWELIS